MGKIIALIPARFAASRFPAKLLQPLGNQPVILHTYFSVINTQLFDEVYVVTDHHQIFDLIISVGGKAIMSIEQHESGTDRIAEAVKDMDIDVIVNVQGDEPFIQKQPLENLIALFKNDAVQVGTLMRKMNVTDDPKNPNAVKVVVDFNGKALYFSRSPIPYQRDDSFTATHYLHVGVYGFRKKALEQFTQLPPSTLEKTEKLEQLRFLENDISIYVSETDYITIAIDTPEDLEKAQKHLHKNL